MNCFNFGNAAEHQLLQYKLSVNFISYLVFMSCQSSMKILQEHIGRTLGMVTGHRCAFVGAINARIAGATLNMLASYLMKCHCGTLKVLLTPQCCADITLCI